MEEDVLFGPQVGPTTTSFAIPAPVSVESSKSLDSSSTPSISTSATGVCTRNISASLGYSEHSKTGTLGLIHRAGDLDALSQNADYRDSWDMNAAERYIALIRQLPSQSHIKRLVQLFFTDLEWYYGVIDEDVFQSALLVWNNVPYTTLRRGPHHLPPEIRAFPALLFHVLAHALLFLPTRLTSALADVKYAPGMTFADLATDYSEAGEAVVSLLRNSDDATMAKVQAGLLRASFLKSTASVVQAWHKIGEAIRDGQELGMASVLDNFAENPVDSMDVSTLDETERRAKLWLMLHLWDGHMGIVLGRPMVTRLESCDWVALFLAIDQRREKLQGQSWSTESPDVTAHRPTPFGMFLVGYKVAYKYLQDIEDLAKMGTDNSKEQQVLDCVNEIDASVTQGLQTLPTWAKHGSGDQTLTTSETWLPAARETLLTEVYFVVLAVHRPFVFLSQRSRDGARQAALHILAAQTRLFGMYEPREYLPFNFIFATFDALVLLATLHILFPSDAQSSYESKELFARMEWGLSRLNAMRMDGCNRLAACAFDTVQALYTKMQTRRKKRPRDEDGTYVAARSLRTESETAVGSSVGTTPSRSGNTLRTDDLSTILSSDEGWRGDWTDLQELGDLPFELFSNEMIQGDCATIANMPPPQPLHDLVTQAGYNGDIQWSGNDDVPLGL